MSFCSVLWLSIDDSDYYHKFHAQISERKYLRTYRIVYYRLIESINDSDTGKNQTFILILGELNMKTIKTFMIAGIMSFTFAISAHAQEAPPACEIVDEVGIVEGYLDCALDCIGRSRPWSARRTACAIDCYLDLVEGVIDFLDNTRII